MLAINECEGTMFWALPLMTNNMQRALPKKKLPPDKTVAGQQSHEPKKPPTIIVNTACAFHFERVADKMSRANESISRSDWFMAD